MSRGDRLASWVGVLASVWLIVSGFAMAGILMDLGWHWFLATIGGGVFGAVTSTFVALHLARRLGI